MILKIKIIMASMNAKEFAIIRGMSLIRIPYMSQTKTAVPKSANVPADMSLVDRVFITLMSCGRSETVVSAAPINPRAIIKSILFYLLGKTHITLFLLTLQ